MITALSIYFALNIVLALGMHVSTLRSTLKRPQPIEFALFFIVFLFFGIPAVLIAILAGARKINREQPVLITRASGVHAAHR